MEAAHRAPRALSPPAHRAGLRGGDSAPARALPDLAAGLLARQDEVRSLASRYRFAERMVITSRGYGCPTAK
jgi:glucosamine--fructose-6-phosphate aminotransferase (isomerizing)